MKSQSKIQGFTLVEVLAAMVVIGILAGIAAPSFLSFANNQRLNAGQSELINAIKSVQSRAKRDKTTVKLIVTDSSIKLGDQQISLNDVKLSSPLGNSVEVEFNAKGLPERVNGQSFAPVDFQVNLDNSNAKRCVTIATLLGALITRDRVCGQV